jgi:uncharacterized membrane protein YhaH (DUF805 family)
MNFATSVQTCHSKYVDFSTRARRSEFWYFFLFTFLVGMLSTGLDRAFGTDFDVWVGGVVNYVATAALVLPSIAVAVRRLHDLDKSGWWFLLALVPVLGWAMLLVWDCTDTKRGANSFGPDPKGRG